MLRKVFELNWLNGILSYIKLGYKKLHNLYPSPIVIDMIKIRKWKRGAASRTVKTEEKRVSGGL
jgi:hypothetical protein